MFFFIDFRDDGAELRLVLNWQRLRAFARGLAITIWVIVSLWLALKSAGIDLSSFVSR
jgi:hypothetical protein